LDLLVEVLELIGSLFSRLSARGMLLLLVAVVAFVAVLAVVIAR